MAKQAQPLYAPGTVAKEAAKLWNPSDPLKDMAYAAAAGKNVADTQKLQADNAAAANFRALIARGNATPQELVAAAAYSPALLAEIPKVHLLQVASDPNANPHARAVAAQAAGVAYGSTEEGVGFVQGHEDTRARIAAGPGYAQANASLQGHRWEHEDRGSKLAQDYRVIQETPEPIFDPVTNTTRWVHKGDLPSLPPGGVVPYSPEAYKGANEPKSFSREPGGVPQLGRSADLSAAFMNPNPPTFYAPTPGDVQVQDREPIEATTPGDTTPRWVTKGDVRRNPGMYSPVPKAGAAGPAPPQPANLPANSDYLAEQALRGQFNLAAGLTGQGFQKGDLGAASPATLPKEIEQRLPEFRTQVQRYAQLNNLNFDDAAWQVMRENYGTPTADASGKQGFNIQLPTFRSLWMASPTVTPGTPAPPRPVATTQEGHAQITPQPATTTTAQPAGAPRPPPNNPTAVLTPPAPTPAYQPGGAQPYVPPTISLGGNPAPAPTPRLLVQPAPPPAPAPAPQPATAPAPNPDTATLLQHAQDAIAAGANAAAVAARLKSQFNIDLPPPPAPAPQASAP